MVVVTVTAIVLLAGISIAVVVAVVVVREKIFRCGLATHDVVFEGKMDKRKRCIRSA